MQLQRASRKQAKIKMALQGPSGSGKTYSSLLVAYGLCKDWNKIAVIDTENCSANLYAHLGGFFTLGISHPFTPEKYIQAIKLCQENKIEVIILDSVSHEWDGIGGILDIHSNMTGNSFTNWGKITPRHNAFVQTILQSPVHIIATIRTKQDYVLNERNGKMVPEKVGLKSVQRDGLDYEFTLVFDLDIKNNATASKDRTGLFFGKPEQKLSVDTGKLISDWCKEGEDIANPASITDNIITESVLILQINNCQNIDQLLSLYTQNPIYQETHIDLFTNKRKELNQIIKPDSLTFKTSSNGTHTS